MKQIERIAVQDPSVQTVVPAGGKFLHAAFVSNQLFAWFQVDSVFHGDEYHTYAVIDLLVDSSTPDGYEFVCAIPHHQWDNRVLVLYVRRGA